MRRLTLLLSLLWSLSFGAVQAAEPTVNHYAYGDLLIQALPKKPAFANMMNCEVAMEQGPNAALLARYAVAEKDLLVAEQWLTKLAGKPQAPRFICCGWDTEPDVSIRGKDDQSYSLGMGGAADFQSQSGEVYFINQRQDFAKIPFLTL